MGKSTINHSFKSYVCLPEGNKYVPEYMPDTVPDNIPLECQLLEVTRFISQLSFHSLSILWFQLYNVS